VLGSAVCVGRQHACGRLWGGVEEGVLTGELSRLSHVGGM
jgi:hypothetical protein